MLTADQILNADDRGDIVKVPVPEWGGEVGVCVMTGSARDYFELQSVEALKSPGSISLRALLCAATICDETGKRLFTNQQVSELAEKSGSALDRVFSKAQEINKISDRDIEELEGN